MITKKRKYTITKDGVKQLTLTASPAKDDNINIKMAWDYTVPSYILDALVDYVKADVKALEGTTVKVHATFSHDGSEYVLESCSPWF